MTAGKNGNKDFIDNFALPNNHLANLVIKLFVSSTDKLNGLGYRSRLPTTPVVAKVV